MSINGPAPRPCESCPYRKDVPSGVWAEAEYEKLRAYDRPTAEQPMEVFQCHQNSKDDDRARVCAGWASCHGTTHQTDLLALRFAEAFGNMTPEAIAAVRDYTSPVPLFASGEEAADHGVAEITHPSPQAQRLVAKIASNREDITYE